MAPPELAQGSMKSGAAGITKQASVPSCAYVTFLAGNGDYVKGVVGLAKGLRKVKSAYPLVVAVLPDVPEEHRRILESQGCIVRQIEPLYPPENHTQFAMAYYVINYSKLRIWEFMEYKKMIYLDGDIQVYENIDELFDVPDGNLNIYKPIPLDYNLVLAMLWRHPQNVDLQKVKVVHYCAAGSKPWRYTGKEENMQREDIKKLVQKWWDIYNDSSLDYKKPDVDPFASVTSCAYVTFLAGNGDYVKGVVGLAKGLRKVKSAYPLVVAVLPDVPEEHRRILESQGCILRQIEPLYPPENQTQFAMAYYVITYSKLRIWEFMEYKKMIYLDGDIQVYENIDELFDVPDGNLNTYKPIPLDYNLVLAILWRHPQNVDLQKVKVVHYCAAGSKPWKYTGKEENMQREDIKKLVQKWWDIYNDSSLDYKKQKDADPFVVALPEAAQLHYIAARQHPLQLI
ncbi:hypothetical protein Ahy_A09g045192 [Arachis hypogaea]|uniref:Hexosyltransferase n=1 Tax=Arachis hypogaea TaxID=3818 RepID=A0A445BLU1_ARAHY|nr:hypothetical protein Ahy_A09g045192 [Arachis hypogaea]